MAKIFQRSPQGYSNSGDFLKKYDDILKKNKQSSVLQGFDTDSPNIQKLPGVAVSDPTGLGGIASNKQTAQEPYEYEGLPSFGNEEDITQIIDVLNNIDPTGLGEGEQNARNFLLEMFAGQAPQPEQQQQPEQQEEDPFTLTRTTQAPQSTNTTSSSLLNTLRGQDKALNNAYLYSPYSNTSDVFNEFYKYNPQQAMQGANKVVSAGQKYADSMQQSNQADQKYIDEAQKYIGLADQLQGSMDFKPSQDEVNQGVQKRLEMARMNQQGIKQSQPQSQVLGVQDWKRPEPTMQQNVGNFVDQLGTNFKLPELGISEKIAGGLTKNSLVKPAFASEPQAGQGLDKIRSEFSSGSPSQMTTKPELSQISPMTRMVGNIGGMGQTASNLASKPSTVAPDQFFSSGMADSYAQYLNGGVEGAQQAKGGALDLSLFNEEFFKDPNAISSVLGNTYMYSPAMEKYKSYEQQGNTIDSQPMSQEMFSTPAPTPNRQAAKPMTSVRPQISINPAKPQGQVLGAKAPSARPAPTPAPRQSTPAPTSKPSMFTPTVRPTPAPTPARPATPAPASKPQASLVQRVLSSLFRR